MGRVRSSGAAEVPPAPAHQIRTFAQAEDQARARHLTIRAAFHPTRDPALPEGTQTVLMLGPDEPGFWPAFTDSDEWRDGTPDPMDRWSRRVIGAWAADVGAHPLYPFGGAPFLPFIRWARDSGWVHGSPVGLLVHRDAGLWVSFRGALALPYRIALPPAPPSPCPSCPDTPCISACPVGALSATAPYDVPACKAHVASPEGVACRTAGCRVRAACPAGATLGRMDAHSAYHMTQFL